jgi:hypothetical protein
MRAIYNELLVSIGWCEVFADFSNLIFINTTGLNVTCLSAEAREFSYS